MHTDEKLTNNCDLKSSAFSTYALQILDYKIILYFYISALVLAPFTHILRIYEHAYEQRAYVCSYISDEILKILGGECDGNFQLIVNYTHAYTYSSFTSPS